MAFRIQNDDKYNLHANYEAISLGCMTQPAQHVRKQKKTKT